LLAKGGSVLITADHGNAEQMLEPDGTSPFTAHTNTDVPLIAVAPGIVRVREGGVLADIAPSVLDLLGIDQPELWTGRSLLERG
ncbi:MAG: 2,3-bisphosphoglycerate-independent phosphoglycerate mutase, partial [Coriobacteriia bacterium]|nr:2,3-bisphosphoglycerate-independent phosphoglycerate mutase [Coriobacteriia bacterium]